MSNKSKKLNYRDRHATDTLVGDVRLGGDKIQRGFKKWPAIECSAELVTDGAEGQRVTAGRVVAGTLIAGPIGTVVGALAKKSNETGILTVHTPSGDVLVKLAGKKVQAARTFMMNLELVQARALGK